MIFVRQLSARFMDTLKAQDLQNTYFMHILFHSPGIHLRADGTITDFADTSERVERATIIPGNPSAGFPSSAGLMSSHPVISE